MIRKIIYSLLLLIFLLIGSLAYIFFRPEVLVNTSNLKRLLEKTHILKSWSWKEASMDWGYIAWDNRTFKGNFKDLCFDYQSEAINVKSCLDEISWDIENLKLSVKTNSPFVVRSSLTDVHLGKSDEEKSGPPDVWKYWSILWSDMTPDMDVYFKTIKVTTLEKKTIELDFKLVKTPKDLNAHAKDFSLWASPDQVIITAPPKIALPKKISWLNTLYFRDFKLTATMKESGIPLKITGFFESADILVNAYLDLPIKDELTSLAFRKKLILTTKAKISIPGFKKNLSFYAPDPFKELPAPLNVMDGSIVVDINTKQMKASDSVMVLGAAHIDLKSSKQVLNFDTSADVPVNLNTYKPQSVKVGLNFNQVQLQLPRLSKKNPPPQFIPDGRFKNAPFKRAERKKTDLDISLKFQALNENAMSFKTNLLDEIVKLNFDLDIQNGKLIKGFVSLFPLQTKVFKRPIKLIKLKVTFRYPVEPVIEAVFNFPLPEYKITVTLEGPISQPRYAFRSVPPLPQNDIYAVLLFGRPMSDLDPDDKTAAQKTNQLLSQGILSLSVLYFLAGSPVEYVGYDPGSKNATAQFGIGNKTSLRVGGGQEGVNSSAVRRSLGKGWYLDTSVQNSSDLSNTGRRNYGVLLERIIAY